MRYIGKAVALLWATQAQIVACDSHMHWEGKKVLRIRSKARSSSSKNLHIRKVQVLLIQSQTKLTIDHYYPCLSNTGQSRGGFISSKGPKKEGTTVTRSPIMNIAYCRTLFFNLYSKYIASFYNGKQRRTKDLVGTVEGQEGKDKRWSWCWWD